MKHDLRVELGKFQKLRPKFTFKELKEAYLNHKPRTSVNKDKNGMYKDGTGEPYKRIRINGYKIKWAHVVWLVHNLQTEIPKGYETHHINNNKRDDRIENLALVDAKKHGMENLHNQYTLTGVKNPNSSLKKELNKLEGFRFLLKEYE